jgi:cell division protein FtsQ
VERIAQPPRNRVGLGLRFRRAMQQARRGTAAALRIGIFAVLALAAAGASVYGVFAISRSSYFRVRGVEVRGTERLTHAGVVRLTGLGPGTSIFAIPARRMERAIAESPWVARATVRRQFPDRVIVDVVERRPKAIVNLSGGGLFYVDPSGVIFKRVAGGDNVDFPVVTGLRRTDLEGPEGRELLARALELQGLLERDPAFGPSRISELHVSRQSGVSVITTGDAMEIRFGPDNFPVKLESLRKLLPALEQRNVRARVIDLSFRNMAIVKPRADDADGNTVGL